MLTHISALCHVAACFILCFQPPAFNMRARLLGNRKAFIHHRHNRQNWESEKKAFQGFEGFDVEWQIQSRIKFIPGLGDEKF